MYKKLEELRKEFITENKKNPANMDKLLQLKNEIDKEHNKIVAK